MTRRVSDLHFHRSTVTPIRALSARLNQMKRESFAIGNPKWLQFRVDLRGKHANFCLRWKQSERFWPGNQLGGLMRPLTLSFLISPDKWSPIECSLFSASPSKKVWLLKAIKSNKKTWKFECCEDAICAFTPHSAQHIFCSSSFLIWLTWRLSERVELHKSHY